jgi:flagellar hook-length control protein FliK
MASIPNTRAAPGPAPAGKMPAAAVDPAGFARQFAGIPEELVRLAAATLCGEGGDAPAPDAALAKDGDAATAEPADAPSDAAQLAALAPMLQPLPAVLPANILPTAPVAQAEPRIEPGAAAAPAPSPTPVASPPAATPVSTGKVRQVKPDAQGAETGPETDSGQPAPAPEMPAKDVIAAAKRAIEAALRPAKPGAGPEAAPKLAQPAAPPAAPIAQAPKEASAPAPAAAIAVPLADLSASAASAALAMPAAPAPITSAQPREAAAPATDRALDLAGDAAWLDRLARDIAQAAGNEGVIRFRLHPQTLGHLRVELSQGDRGTSVRLTADTEQARYILADAQPRLVAEARAQGVRIAESHVDLSGSDRSFSDDPRRQGDASQTPMIRTARDAAAGEDAPERPGRSRSDRYA